jgi:transposase
MQFAADRLEAPTAIRTDLGAIFISLELSRSSWVVTSLSPGGGEKMSKHTVRGGDVAGLLKRFAQLREKAKGRTGKVFPLIVIQEAGLDGFWIDRVVQNEGIESHVVDPASIATSRRRRRAKTDGIDGEALVRALLAYKRGEPRVCSMVRLPTPEDEDRRRLCRERKVLIAERVKHVNRIKGLLFSQGVSGYEPLRRDRRERLDALQTGDGAGPCPRISKRRFVANLIGSSCLSRRSRLWRPSGMRCSPWNKPQRLSRRRCCWA